MKENFTAICLVILATGCGSSGERRSIAAQDAGGAAGDTVVETGGSPTSGSGGQTSTTGGTGGVEPAGGSGNDVTGGQAGVVLIGGAGGEPTVTGGGAGEPASGGTGNVGGGCEPWDCTNIAISLSGWDPNSNDPVPEACGLVEDPCTGMMIECGGCSLGHQTCGGMVFSDLFNAARSEPERFVIPGADNLCNGQCVWTQYECSTPTTNLVNCSNQYVQPNETCEGSYMGWCCEDLPPLTE